MMVLSFSGAQPSPGGSEAARAVASATAIGGVCSAGRPAPGRTSSDGLEFDLTGIVGRSSRHDHQMERLAAGRGRYAKDLRNYRAQMGRADPGP